MASGHSESRIPANSSATRRVVLGRIRTAVGLAGWVKVESYTNPPDNLLNFPSWQIADRSGWRMLAVVNSRWSGKELQVQFAEVNDRNAAELLRNTDVAVFRHELPPPEPGEYYWDDLLGLQATTDSGVLLGTLDHFLDTPAHPLMVIQGQDAQGKRTEHLVPVVKGLIQQVDMEAGTMVLNWSVDWVE